MSAPEFLITLPPPTPNGGLHLGHLSGPFLAADVFNKHCRLAGHHCFSTSFSDANQSYVRVTAERQRRDPGELAHYWTRDILETLAIYGADVDDFFYPSADSCGFVRKLFCDAYQKGVLKRKAFPFLYSPQRGLLLDEAGVSGFCPRCLASCKCGICEACAFLNNASTLVAPRDTITGFDGLELRHVEVMTLQPEDFRTGLVGLYRDRGPFRARYMELATEALAGSLPDFPVSVPGQWGIQVEHPDFPGQVINAWAELMAHLLWSYECAAPKLGQQPKVVNFFGFDNSYFYAVVHASLFMALGCENWLPQATVNNEFYNLEHSKFSTSNNHVVWARDLAARHSPDAIRFFAAFNNPGFEKSNFSEPEMAAVVERVLVQPWQQVCDACSELLAHDRGYVGEPSDACTAIGLAALDRIDSSYTLEHFHLRRAAEDLVHFLRYMLDRLAWNRLSGADAAVLLKCFAQAAYPLMPLGSAKLYGLVAGRSLERYDRDASARLTSIPADIFTRLPEATRPAAAA